MEGLQNELKEYKRLYWPEGRCIACEFPIRKTISETEYTRCRNKECKKVIKCPRPSCPGAPAYFCAMCGAPGCYDDIKNMSGCLWRCSKCERPICLKCNKEFGCEHCNGDWGGTTLCGDCMAPFQVHTFRYAGNVKRPERVIGCRECYEHWQTYHEFQLQRECEKCALDDCPGKRCAQSKCFEYFCPHRDLERKLCDAHIGGMNGSKRAKPNDKDE